MKSRLLDLELWLHHETPGAILVSTEGDLQKAAWLPKSAVEIEARKGGTIVLAVPESLAIDKGLC
jgi:hypothetical protein